MCNVSRWDFLSELEDDKLLELHANGNKWALDQLMIRHTPLVKKRVAAMLGNSVDVDDAVQEGMLGLLSAVVNYDPDRKAAFTTFAYRCITNRILNWMERNSAGNISAIHKQVGLCDLEENLLADDDLDPQEIFINREALGDLDERFSKMLTGLEKSVLTLYYTGGSYEDIGRALGIGAKAVDNALQRIRKKLSR